MKQKIIGTFYMGHTEVELVLREGDGGEFYAAPERGKIPRIKVGADYKEWRKVVQVLLHEAMELVMEDMYLRYNCSKETAGDHASYMFMFNHSPQFTEICARVGDFLTDALPALATEWKKWKKRRTK